MNKTLSLFIRVIALLAAIGAGVAWYFIHEENIKLAMTKTESFTKDEEIKKLAKWSATDPLYKDGINFVARMTAMPGIHDLINAKRKEIEQHIATIAARDATIAQRDQTIVEKNDAISKLEGEKADLIRTRDDLTGKLGAANNKIGTLEADLQQAQAEREALNKKMNDTEQYMPRAAYDEQVGARNKAEDDLQRAASRYTRLYNWSIAQTGLTPPYSKSVTDPDPVATGPVPKEVLPRIPTTVIAVDHRRGVLSISLGLENRSLKEGQIYDVEDRVGVHIGKIRISKVEPGLSVATILPGANHRLFIRDNTVNLVRAQVTGTKNVAPSVPTTPTPPAAKAPASAVDNVPVAGL
ncbi:MAG: hypothetical protein LBS59_02220 [Puniceicoccales bacterium]|jgi:hypothetical protein|nr:hypothetical protein [Puniceicoccales bacterium]